MHGVGSDFVRYVVQESDDPATAEEIAAAEALCT